ncbi:MAG: YceI family protein [Flavobacteriaceae bacterium]
MRFSILLFFILCTCLGVSAQEKFFTKQGYISFFSHTSVEDIKAENKQVLSIIDLSTGEIAVTLLMKSFAFEKALMQEHFNENYVESDKYPKATFTGSIQNLSDLLQGNNTIAEIKGNLTIKGITKPVTIESKALIEKDSIVLKGKFMVTVADFNIKIPAIVRKNIADSVEVTFVLTHQPYKK